MPQLSEIISQLSQNCLYLKALKHARKAYTICESDLKVLSPYSVFQHLKRLNSRIEPPPEANPEEPHTCESFMEECWHPSQYKLFSWISVCYAFTINKDINEFEPHNLDFIANIFRKKKRIFIEYHLLCLQKQTKVKKEEWAEEEINLFLDILKEERLKGKWSDISYNLYYRSDQKYFRTPHKCREMWFNHLNPIVNHSKWTPQEDLELFKLASQIGTKWSQISKAINGVRTEHMVKNRFNSITKRYQTRFQRCSIKKMTELIRIDLEKRLATARDVEESSNSKDNEAVSQSEPSLKRQNQSIQEEQSEGDPADENCKKEEVCQTSCQVAEGEEKEQKEQKQQKQEKQGRKALGQYQVDYEAIKMENMECQGNMLEWALVARQRNVELIDYMGFDYQNKPTIFSGTNS